MWDSLHRFPESSRWIGAGLPELENEVKRRPWERQMHTRCAALSLWDLEPAARACGGVVRNAG
jgi:hypothetical protein